MKKTKIFRYVLALAAIFNVYGAYVFAFPASPAGQMAGLPANVPISYRFMVALFALLFGGAYAWLASQSHPNRGLVAFGAIGKFSAFVLVLILWMMSEVPIQSVTSIAGDLLFAGAFAWWLFSAHHADVERAKP